MVCTSKPGWQAGRGVRRRRSRQQGDDRKRDEARSHARALRALGGGRQRFAGGGVVAAQRLQVARRRRAAAWRPSAIAQTTATGRGARRPRRTRPGTLVGEVRRRRRCRARRARRRAARRAPRAAGGGSPSPAAPGRPSIVNSLPSSFSNVGRRPDLVAVQLRDAAVLAGRGAWSSRCSARSPPSSCAPEVRRISGQRGHGVRSSGRSGGGSGSSSNWVIEAGSSRCELPRQSAPVSPPPMITTCLPAAEIGVVGGHVAGDEAVALLEVLHREVDAVELAARARAGRAGSVEPVAMHDGVELLAQLVGA